MPGSSMPDAASEMIMMIGAISCTIRSRFMAHSFVRAHHVVHPCPL
jgi:hypothetical protein